MVVTVFAWITAVVGILFFLLAFYRAVFLFLPLFRKPVVHRPTEIHKIGVLISARNEEAVLPFLLDSLRKQDYPADMFRVYVVADNCTDKTAEVAAAGGATVFVRKNLRRIGKGYALNYLIGEIHRSFPDNPCDAYIVCDADNVLEPNYISELNKLYCDGYPIVTGVRNTKNFSKGWVSAGYGVYFMYRSQYLNRSRMQCGMMPFVSGTGFLVDKKLLEKAGGWQFFSMSEDTEFSAHFLIHDADIAYAENAVLYDEQPIGFRQMWAQRGRWMKGRLQALRRYGKRIFKKDGKPSFSQVDFFLSLFLLNAVGTLLFGLALTTTFLGLIVRAFDVGTFFKCLLAVFTCIYAVYFSIGAYTVLTEWRAIHARSEKKLFAILSYPFFMMMDIPLFIKALMSRAKWVSVPHSDSRSLQEVKKEGENADTSSFSEKKVSEQKKTKASPKTKEKP